MRRIYIHQDKAWPNFTWDHEALLPMLGQVRNLQGRLMGKMEAMGLLLKNQATLETLSLDVLKSTEIEGEFLNSDQVRSSVARHLGMEYAGMVPSDRNVDGMVEMMMDATVNYQDKLTAKRLYSWHAALFPTGRSGMHKITVGQWRKDDQGPMQVVSGALGKEKVHFEAPHSSLLAEEMKSFITWFNSENSIDPVIKAGVTHLWLVTIHPFDDGNGRIARAITDMLLARSDCSSQRFYSMSAQIRIERKQYYELLETTQQGSLNITAWLQWFLNCLMSSINNTSVTLQKIHSKDDFWKTHAHTKLNERQKLILNKMLDHFDGNLTSSKWAKMTKCSPDTALRDIQDLINKDILIKDLAGGRSTHYILNN